MKIPELNPRILESPTMVVSSSNLQKRRIFFQMKDLGCVLIYLFFSLGQLYQTDGLGYRKRASLNGNKMI